MAEQIKQRWRLLALRVICALCAVSLNVWAANTPQVMNEKMQTQPAASATNDTLTFAITPARSAMPSPVKAQPAPTTVSRTPTAVQKKGLASVVAEPLATLNAPASEQAVPTANTAASVPTAAPGVHELALMSEPKFVSQPSPPQYPAVARKRGQEGTVWVDILLDAQGSQSQLQLYKSSGIAVLDSAALLAVSHWHFKPYEMSGVGQPSRVRIPIEFRLN